MEATANRGAPTLRRAEELEEELTKQRKSATEELEELKEKSEATLVRQRAHSEGELAGLRTAFQDELRECRATLGAKLSSCERELAEVREDSLLSLLDLQTEIDTVQSEMESALREPDDGRASSPETVQLEWEDAPGLVDAHDVEEPLRRRLQPQLRRRGNGNAGLAAVAAYYGPPPREESRRAPFGVDLRVIHGSYLLYGRARHNGSLAGALVDRGQDRGAADIVGSGLAWSLSLGQSQLYTDHTTPIHTLLRFDRISPHLVYLVATSRLNAPRLLTSPHLGMSDIFPSGCGGTLGLTKHARIRNYCFTVWLTCPVACSSISFVTVDIPCGIWSDELTVLSATPLPSDRKMLGERNCHTNADA